MQQFNFFNRFKKLVEDGKFVPEEVVQRLQAKGQLISKCPFLYHLISTKKPTKFFEGFLP